MEYLVTSLIVTKLNLTCLKKRKDHSTIDMTTCCLTHDIGWTDANELIDPVPPTSGIHRSTHLVAVVW
jgi:hypothetical protein